MAGQGQAAAPAKARSWIWAQGLACGLLVATAAPLAFTLAVLFAPAASVLVLASAGARRLAGILLIYGLAAALPWLDVLWSSARSWAATLDLLGEMRLLGVCWGAQAAGWLMGEAVPLGVRMVLDGRVRARIARLQDARARLREEWGLGGEEDAEGGVAAAAREQ
jgi:hypothetical protein